MKNSKSVKKEFEILLEKEASETQIAVVKEKVEKVTCIIKLVNRHIQEGKSLIDKLEKVFDYDHFCRQYSKENEKNGGI